MARTLTASKRRTGEPAWLPCCVLGAAEAVAKGEAQGSRHQVGDTSCCQPQDHRLLLLLLFGATAEICLSDGFCRSLGRSEATPRLLSLRLQGALQLVSRLTTRALVYPAFLCPTLCPTLIVDLFQVLLYNAIGVVGTARVQLRQSVVVAVCSAIL